MLIIEQRKVQECCGWEFAAKLGELDYRFTLTERERERERKKNVNVVQVKITS